MAKSLTLSGAALFGDSPTFRNDPEGPLAALRARAPAHFDPETGAVLITGYPEARAALADRGLWRHPYRADADSRFGRLFPRRAGCPLAQNPARTPILFLDDPDHGRIRGALAAAFHRRAAAMGPATAAIVSDILGGLSGRRRVDIIAEIAAPIPILVIAAILGVEPERMRDFRDWSEGLILTTDPGRSETEKRRAVAAQQALDLYLAEMMEARRHDPRDDLLSDIVRLQAEGAPLTDAEARVNCTALLVGGNLTTTDLIGNGLWLLLRDPTQRARLAADPALAPAAIEEILRLEGSVIETTRVAGRDLEIGGETVRAGTPMTIYLRAANRDPAFFADPDRFDIGRRGPPHLAFGGGGHYCIGAPLARLEARIALPMILARWPRMRLAETTPSWRPAPSFRGLRRLLADVG